MCMKNVLLLGIALLILTSAFGMTQSSLCQSRACPLKNLSFSTHIFDADRFVSRPLYSFVGSFRCNDESPSSWDVRTESFSRRGPPVGIIA